ncbi:MAG: 3-isopropylmalate dehydratase small subunit [Propionibacterium sp.]|nr:MAG: 3-isopropylmalate dehydratase small subunit [Propionibacterium sp.]
MDKFITHTGIAAPLQRSNVDTDQIIPASYLKRITRTGFEDGLFAAWRNDPNFVLNQKPYDQASILVVGPDFGTGSSREHAVWALQNFGFKVVVGSRFGDIFRSNSGKAGLLIATVDHSIVEQLWKFIETDPAAGLTVDLKNQTILAGEKNYLFEIAEFTKHRLLNGLDDISMTLTHEAEISSYEANRKSFAPKTLPARTAD